MPEADRRPRHVARREDAHALLLSFLSSVLFTVQKGPRGLLVVCAAEEVGRGACLPVCLYCMVSSLIASRDALREINGKEGEGGKRVRQQQR